MSPDEYVSVQCIGQLQMFVHERMKTRLDGSPMLWLERKGGF